MGIPPMRQLHLLIPTGLYDALRRIAAEEDRPVTSLARQALWKLVREREQTLREAARDDRRS